MFLTEEEIHRLTGRTTKPAQIKTLCEMGIEHRINADGCPIVLVSHLNKIMGGNSISIVHKNKYNTPNLAAI